MIGAATHKQSLTPGFTGVTGPPLAPQPAKYNSYLSAPIPLDAFVSTSDDSEPDSKKGLLPWIISLFRWRDGKGALGDISLSLCIYLLRELMLNGMLYRALPHTMLKEELKDNSYEVFMLRKIFQPDFLRIEGVDLLAKNGAKEFVIPPGEVYQKVISLRERHEESQESAHGPQRRKDGEPELTSEQLEAKLSSYQSFTELTGQDTLSQPFSFGKNILLEPKGRLALKAELTLRHITKRLMEGKASKEGLGIMRRGSFKLFAAMMGQLVIAEGLLEVFLGVCKLPFIKGISSNLAYVMPWVMFLLLGNLYSYRDDQRPIDLKKKGVRNTLVGVSKAGAKFLKDTSHGFGGFGLTYLSRDLRGNFEDDFVAKNFFKNGKSPSTLFEHGSLAIIKTSGKIFFDAAIIVAGSRFLSFLWHKFKERDHERQLKYDESIYQGTQKFPQALPPGYRLNGLTASMQTT